MYGKLVAMAGLAIAVSVFGATAARGAPKKSNHNEFWSLLKQTRQQPIARKASWISWRRS
jgi:hypothetical protein